MAAATALGIQQQTSVVKQANTNAYAPTGSRVPSLPAGVTGTTPFFGVSASNVAFANVGVAGNLYAGKGVQLPQPMLIATQTLSGGSTTLNVPTLTKDTSSFTLSLTTTAAGGAVVTPTSQIIVPIPGLDATAAAIVFFVFPTAAASAAWGASQLTCQCLDPAAGSATGNLVITMSCVNGTLGTPLAPPTSANFAIGVRLF